MNTRNLGDLEVSSTVVGCMGMSANYGPIEDRGQ
jgi:aryl-alcohol dehydrogenase-like predicted oxidoreductase